MDHNAPIYLAHYNKDVSQTVKDHLKNVSQLCHDYLEELGCGETGTVLGLFHDFGKYSDRFAKVLSHEKIHVNHSFPGAALLWQFCSQNMNTACILSTVAASHHGNVRPIDKESVVNYLSGRCEYDPSENEYSIIGNDELKKAVRVFKEETEISKSSLKLPIPSSKFGDMLERMLCVRMLLSALADADYTDTASVYDVGYAENTTDVPFEPQKALERLLDLRDEKQKRSTADKKLDRLRQRLFDDCMNAGKNEPGIYTLTAPTGLGKTMSLMAFALQYCIEHPKMRRVILLLPFLAIAKQNADDYRKVFPELLESHSAVELTEQTKYLSERWSAPCIITTNVGFFEPLFADKAVDVRRLHQITNSVIVLDEAQSLPPELLDSTLKTIKSLCDNYGCTFVFSTATQPYFSARPALKQIWQSKEIVPDPQALFSAVRRVQMEWRTNSQTSFEQIARELAGSPSGCAIVNLRKHAALLYDKVCGYRDPDEVFLLSTDLCREHREKVIRTVRERLTEGLPTLLISTQCIEAGVDLDFPVLYRAFAPLESIIQAAGRVNRNGNMTDGGRVIVFIPDVPERQKYPRGSYYQNAANCVLTLLSRHPIDCSDLSHIREYYELLYPFSGGDKKALRDSIEKEDYEGTAKAYKLIESGGVQVVVPYEDNIELYKSIRKKFDEKGLTKELMAEARPITVTSFDIDSVKELCQSMTLRSWDSSDEVNTRWYLLGNTAYYNDKKGLTLEIDAEDYII